MSKFRKKKDIDNSNKREEQAPSKRVNKLPREKTVHIVPRNTAQEEYLLRLNDYSNRIIFAIGPAGTGKSMLATQFAIKELLSGKIKKIIISRPAVTVDEDLGFLPGDMLEKMAPFIRPIMDIFEETYSKQQVLKMMEDGIIEICPLGHIRGRTFKHSIVILDECQSTTVNQLKAALTRIGEGSRMVVTGDLRQADKGMDGLHDFLGRVKGRQFPGIGVVEFEHKHIERDPIVTTILKIYGDTD